VLWHFDEAVGVRPERPWRLQRDRGLPPWRPHVRFRRVQTGGALLFSESRSAKPPPPDKQQQGDRITTPAVATIYFMS
jgi:hypothetical protein